MARVCGVTQFYLPSTHLSTNESIHQMEAEPSERGSAHPITGSLLIYQPLKDERLSWPSWLTLEQTVYLC